MKTTVLDLIDYLKAFPSDTTVQILEEYTVGYQTSTTWTDLDLEKHTFYYSKQHILELGSN